MSSKLFQSDILDTNNVHLATKVLDFAPTSPGGDTGDNLTCPVNTSCCAQPLKTCKADGLDSSCPLGFRYCFSGYCVNENFNASTKTCSPDVGLGQPDAATCGPISIDGTDIKAANSIVVNQPHHAIIKMKHPLTSGGAATKDWDSGYYLHDTGSSAALGLSTHDIHIRSGATVSGDGEYDFSVDFTPTTITGSPFDFKWRMKNSNNEEFGGECTPTISVVSAAPPGGGSTSCSGAAQPDTAGNARNYECLIPGSVRVGCTAIDSLSCATPASCYACTTTTGGSNTFNFSQCGICKNNPQKQTDDPSCNNSSAIKEDDSKRCTKKTTIGGKQFKDTCIEASCVSASQTRDCLVCFGSSCQPDSDLCTDPAKPICEVTQPNRGFCVAQAGVGPSPSPSLPPGSLACTKFELTGLTKSGTTNSGGGPIYTAPSAGSNNQFDLNFTPSDATPVISVNSKPAAAPVLNITKTNTGTSVVRIANIPSNTSATDDNEYTIKGEIDKGTDSVKCLDITVIVPKVGGGGGGGTPSTCPADINSTEVKFKNDDNTGSWTGQKTISANQSVKVAGFHNKVTSDVSPPADISNLLVSGPSGFSTTHPNGTIFTPPADLPPGAYVFTATTSDKVGDKCTGTSTLIVTATPPAPAPAKNTLCFAFGEGDGGKTAVDAVTTTDATTFCKTVADGGKVDNVLIFPYTEDPKTFKDYTFKDQTPGIKTFFVKFIGLEGTATKVTQTIQRSITFKPNPQITNVSCTHSSSGGGTDIKIVGTNFGAQGKGKVKVVNEEITPDSWDGTTNTITGKLDQRLEGKIPIEVILDDSRVAKGECVVNTTTVVFKTLMQCKAAGSFAASNVDIKVFEALPLSTGAQTPEPILRQKISLNNNGEPQNFAPKFEKKKKYQLIIKVPGTIAKKVDFDTKDGGTTNIEEVVNLPQGDIAPANTPDGKINAFDKSELIRQWSLITDVARTGDLNGDSRVNSIDYACMRINFNATDETYSAPGPSTSPSPTPSPSSPVCAQVVTRARNTTTNECKDFPDSCIPAGWVVDSNCTPTPSLTPSPTPPGGGTGGTAFRVSFDPLFPASAIQQGTIDPVTGEAIIDITLPEGAGVKSVYIQFSEDGGGSWNPSPPTVATITLI